MYSLRKQPAVARLDTCGPCFLSLQERLPCGVPRQDSLEGQTQREHPRLVDPHGVKGYLQTSSAYGLEARYAQREEQLHRLPFAARNPLKSKKLVILFEQFIKVNGQLVVKRTNLSNPKPGNTTGGSGRGARQNGRAGLRKIGCQQKYSPGKQKVHRTFQRMEDTSLQRSREARISETLLKPTQETNRRLTTISSAVYHRMRSVCCSWLPTSGTKTFRLCTPFFPDMPCMKRVYKDK